MSFNLDPLMMILGALFALAGILKFGESRWLRGAFWLLLGLMTAFASWLSDLVLGCAVIALALMSYFAKTEALPDDPSGAAERAYRHGVRLLVPALALPLVTLIATLWLRHLIATQSIDAKLEHAALYGLLCAVVFGLGAAWWLLAVRPWQAANAGARLLDSIGWPLALPLLLAVLGAVYAKAGLGDLIADMMDGLFPTDSRFACIAAYALGMAAFTLIMGNAFAAFPVMTIAIGIPLVVVRHGGDPAAMAAMGMLAGYCGTLMTPLAANFNLVPVALLNLDSQYAVIRQQIATALPVLAGTIGLMWWLV